MATAGRALPIAIVGVVMLGALSGIGVSDLSRLPSLLGHTLLFAVSTLALAWPLALVLRPVMPAALRALPPVAVGTLLGLLGAWLLPDGGSLSAWVLGVVATALVVAPRLAAELAVSVSPARIQLRGAALALGATQREAARLAASADHVERDVLLRGLALVATDGVAALAVWRIVGAHDLVLAGATLLTDHGGVALPLVVVLALPAGFCSFRTHPGSVTQRARAASHVEVTP
ncbi:MAG: hypothetical protein ABI321_16870 [Polyangia bacterium]